MGADQIEPGRRLFDLDRVEGNVAEGLVKALSPGAQPNESNIFVK